MRISDWSSDVCSSDLGFPTFLAALPDLGGHNYLPDVAAFEWALNVAYHADDAALLRPEDLPDPDAVGRMRFPLHPSAQRLSTPFPITQIWQVHQPDAEPVDRIVQNGRASCRERVGQYV